MGLYAWAVMNNHTHVVLRVDPRLPHSWDDEEVAARWSRLRHTLDGPADPEVATARKQILLKQPERLAEIRDRLGSPSWFMRFLNQSIARTANAEDQCTGRFWEGRFRCQALLDDAAVLACMAYVDLNPIRAGLCDRLINSDFTTIQRRLRSLESGPNRGRTTRTCHGLWRIRRCTGNLARGLRRSCRVDRTNRSSGQVRHDRRQAASRHHNSRLARLVGPLLTHNRSRVRMRR